MGSEGEERKTKTSGSSFLQCPHLLTYIQLSFVPGPCFSLNKSDVGKAGLKGFCSVVQR